MAHTPSETDSDRGTDPLQRPSRSSAVVSVTLTLVLLGLALGVLLYRSFGNAEPRTGLIVHGDSAWNGVQLVVDGGGLTEPRATFIERRGDYSVPFYLPPGEYEFRVKNGGVEMYSKQITVADDGRVQEIDLNAIGVSPPATQPATTESAALSTTAPAT